MPRHKNRPSDTWKAAERRVLAFWPGGKRRGAYVNDGENGMPDSSDDLIGWSIEVKHAKRPTLGSMIKAVAQAEKNKRNEGDIPVAVVHPEGVEYKDSLVVMRLETFAQFFINS